MKIVLVLAAVVAVALAAPQGLVEKPKVIPIVQYDEQRDAYGQFALSYQSGDGTSMTRQGALKPTADGKDHVLIQSGSHTYTAPNGEKIRLTWTADEEGYHPVGDHLPTPPPALEAAGASADLA